MVEQSASDILQLQLGVILPADEITITLQYAITLDISESGAVKFVFPTFLPHQLQSNYTGEGVSTILSTNNEVMVKFMYYIAS